MVLMDGYNNRSDNGGSTGEYVSREDVRAALYTIGKYLAEHKMELLIIGAAAFLATTPWVNFGA